ncbi:YrhB domain-containing protein [Streptomyces sp. 4N509B]|uniref:YrhB domain-containing protein n=1 Tax=Streptomyces sp. 4N509B TaxID=3457413 RepID=UPI003FD4B7FC
MLSKEEAISMAEDYLREVFTLDQQPWTPVMEPDSCTEYDHLWAVPFDTQEHIDTGDIQQAPLVRVVAVPKDGSRIHFPPTAIPADDYFRQFQSDH